MKSEFINITNSKGGQPIFLYGNLKKAFDIVCDEIKANFVGAECHFCSVQNAIGLMNSQCDLFGNKLKIICIDNVEDNHLEKLKPFLYDEKYIFVLQSGDYVKSKKVTKYFVEDRNSLAIASFKNEITLRSLCNFVFPGLPIDSCKEILKMINDTDENFRSLFFKLKSLLEIDASLLKDYITYKRSKFDDLQAIPLIRYLSQIVMHEKIGSSYMNQKLTKLLQYEMRIKNGENISNSIILSI